MKSRTFFFLSFTALSLLTAAVDALQTTVSTANELMKVFETVSDVTMRTDVVITQDIDFTGIAFSPFGLDEGFHCVPYRGTLNGNGHVISGLVVNQTGEILYPSSGLFCGLNGAIIKNIVFDNSTQVIGTNAGALAVFVYSSATI